MAATYTCTADCGGVLSNVALNTKTCWDDFAI